jgi:hypothetical protein
MLLFELQKGQVAPAAVGPHVVVVTPRGFDRELDFGA